MTEYYVFWLKILGTLKGYLHKMKRLVLLRHAKSSWDFNVSDKDRPLTEKGINRITMISFNSSNVLSGADLIFSSPANRALHTACIMINSLGLSFNKIVLKKELYTFELSKLLDFIFNISDDYNSVICVGHNPAFSEAISHLSKTDSIHLPTSAWAELNFSQIKWKNISDGKLKLGMPKEILR
tara:strand:+ start:5452 stop:6000 length:549 start_codon:yes stop_codon:yes gene_type:complete